MNKKFLFLVIYMTVTMISLSGLRSARAQLGCLSYAISSNPNIGTAGAPNYLVGIDANNCPITRPTSNYVAVRICNTCPTAVNAGSITFTGTNLAGVGLVATQTPTQIIGTLAPGECRDIYYHLEYSCNPTNNDEFFVMSFLMNDGNSTAPVSFNFTKRKLIDANAGGLVINHTVTSSNVLGGNTILDCVFEFGNLPNTNSVLSFHPLSDTLFNSQCFQLVGSQVIATSAPTCIPIGFNQMAYVPPGGNGIACDNASITVRYTFRSLCPNTSSSLVPMTYATSGGQIKKRVGLSSGLSISFQSGAGLPTISKTVNKQKAAPGDTLTYAIQICNPSPTDTTAIDQVVDFLPAGFVYAGIAAGSNVTASEFSSAPASGAQGTLTFSGGMSTAGTFRSIVIPPNGCRTLSIRAIVPSGYNNYGVRTNAAIYRIGSVGSDTAKAPTYIQKNVVQADVQQTTMNTPVSGSVATNDDCYPGTVFSLLGSPLHGQLVLNPNGSYTYTPHPNYVGEDSVQYVACLPANPNVCDTTTLYLTVTHPMNNLINEVIAQEDVATTLRGVPVQICILCNDSDPNGNTLSTPVLLNQPANGTAVLNPNGTVTYTPAPGFSGTDRFKYVICDNGTPVACDTADVIVEVLPIDNVGNQTIANDDAGITTVNTALNLNLAANDTDPQGHTVTFSILNSPLHGTATLSPSGQLTYTPGPDYVGPDYLVYTKCDNGTPVACDTATVYITVHEPHIRANVDFQSTLTGQPVSGSAAVNDIIPAGSQFSLIGTSANGGTFSLSPSGTYTFTPAPGFSGKDSIQYQVCTPAPGSVCDTAWIVITVLSNNYNAANSVIAVNDYGTTIWNTPLTTCVLCNDSDPNGHTLGLPTLLAQPAFGTAVVLPGGGIQFTPALNFSGTVEIPYVVCDNFVPQACDTAILYIEVLPIPVGTNVTFGQDDFAMGMTGTTINGNVLQNDSDPQGHTQTVTPQTVTVPNVGTLTLNSNGTYSFVPAGGFTGPVQFPYTVCDNGTPQACSQATLYLLVTPFQFPLPVQLNNFEVKPETCGATLTWSAQGGVDFSHFEVERLLEANYYATVENIEAKPHAGTQYYSYTDGNLPRGIASYRLKMVDHDGRSQYTATKSIFVDCQSISLYPNPSSGDAVLSINAATDTWFKVQLYDATGRSLYTTELSVNGHRLVQLPVAALSAGVYYVVVSDEMQSTQLTLHKINP